MQPTLKKLNLLFPEELEKILYQPIERLVNDQDELLRGGQVFQSAFESLLYHDRWVFSKVDLDQLKGRDGLRQLPLIDGNDLITCFETRRKINKTLLTKPRFWQTSRGTTGDKKWMPLTIKDILHWFQRAKRLSDLYQVDNNKTHTLVLAINEPKPRVSNAIPYLWEQVDYHIGSGNMEWIIVSMEMLHRNHWDHFAIKKKPDWMMSSVRDALDLSDKIDLGNYPDIQTAMPELDKGFFWGAHLDGAEDHRSILTSKYGLSESHALYFSAECREMYAECSAHDGLHLWMDEAIHEIRLNNGEILFVDQASAGMEGEYIFTCFYEALPLIRYRTGDLIRVVSNDPCECGITHPRVNFFGRVEG
ncbi:hypothetical protein EU522_01415 [Candidatus Thorarchaeota archaeon]|nr:MAG: hypothetical protein EU522_01415 [Candidatus Thorarchaeota archaeon]